MPFLGSTPADKYQSLAKQTITGDGSTAYTLNRSVTPAKVSTSFSNTYSTKGTAIALSIALG